MTPTSVAEIPSQSMNAPGTVSSSTKNIAAAISQCHIVSDISNSIMARSLSFSAAYSRGS